METIRKEINQSLDGESVAKLYYLLKDNDKDKLTIRQVNLDNEVTQPHLTELSRQSLNSTFIDNSELSIRYLSEADDRKNIVYKDDVGLLENSLDFFRQIYADITNTEFNIFENYNIKIDSDKKIFGYVIAIGNSSQQIMYFTKHYAVSTFSTKQFILMPLLGIDKKDEQLFTKVETELVRISKKIDILFIEDKVYVCNLEMLESFFQYTEFIHKEANNTIDMIKELGLLENYEKLEEVRYKMPVARKLARASKNSQVLNLLKKNDISNSHIIDFVNNNSEYFDIKIIDKRLKVDTNREVNSFLKLLSDPLVISELTDLTYESTNKDLIN